MAKCSRGHEQDEDRVLVQTAAGGLNSECLRTAYTMSWLAIAEGMSNAVDVRRRSLATFKLFAAALAILISLAACSREVTVYTFTNQHFAFLSKMGKLIHWPDGASAVTGFHDGFAVYKTESSAGFIIGLDGVLHPKQFYFDRHSMLSDGLALVRDPKTSKFCYIDSEGNRKIETALTLTDQRTCHPFSDGLAAMFVPNKLATRKPPLDPPSPGMSGIRHGLWGYIDKTGKFIIEPKFASASDFSCGRARVTLPAAPEKIVVIDKSGKPIFESPYDERWSFSDDGLAVFRSKSPGGGYMRDRCGLADRHGNVSADNLFLENYSDGLGLLVPTQHNEPFFFVDAKGKKRLEISAKRRVWSFISDYPCFSDGFAAIVIQRYPRSTGKKRELYAQNVYEYIDKAGSSLKINTDKVITTAYPFTDGYAVVELRSMSSKEETTAPK